MDTSSVLTAIVSIAFILGLLGFGLGIVFTRFVFRNGMKQRLFFIIPGFLISTAVMVRSFWLLIQLLTH